MTFCFKRCWLFVVFALVVSIQALAIDYDAYDEDVAALLWEYENGPDQARSIRPSVLVFNDVADSDTVVDFESGLVIVTATDLQLLQESIVEILLTQIDPSVIDAKTASDFGLVNQNTRKPFFWKQILDHRGKPIEHPWTAELFADHLAQSAERFKGRYRSKISMVREHKNIAGGKYIQYVKAAGRQHNVSASLMMAIMETESSFNPLARSGSNALGLMQIKANTAGRDYFSIIKGYKHTTSSSYLYNTSNNIEVAAGYLRILGTRYLSGIKHPKKREYAIISSYNGGAGNLWRSLDKNGNKTKSLARINNMTVSEFYWFLTNRHIRGETRNYLKKVSAKQKKYLNL